MNNIKKLILGFGPPKCGTTSLYHALCESSYICKSTIKEPRFFTMEEQPDFSALPAGLEVRGSYDLGIDWFRGLFSSGDEFHIDFTTYYPLFDDVPVVAKSHYANVYGICVLRDPVDRFVSHYYQYCKVGIELPTLEEAIYGDSEFSKFMYKFCDYEQIVDRYYASLGKSQCLIMDFELLKSDHKEVERVVNKFLDIDDFVYSPSSKTKNVAGVPRSKFVSNLLFNRSFRQLTGKLPASWRAKLLNFRKYVIKANTSDSQYAALEEQHVAYLRSKLGSSIIYYENIFSKNRTSI